MLLHCKYKSEFQTQILTTFVTLLFFGFNRFIFGFHIVWHTIFFFAEEREGSCNCTAPHIQREEACNLKDYRIVFMLTYLFISRGVIKRGNLGHVALPLL